MQTYNPVEIILKKRDGYALDQKEVSFFINGFLDGRIADYQMSALLMSCFFQGMNLKETIAFTKSYIESGESLHFDPSLPVVDKHSTGGVGDKISIMLAPIAAALGLYVPMISGRGLGHTGGTLDKLETIPGFQTAYSMKEFHQLVIKHGFALAGQSDTLVPADKKIYALRDVTATVENPGLITASIMSKKIAEGAHKLVIDLKVGSGAFMPNLCRAKELAESLVETGRHFGQTVQVLFTNMNSPLGRAVGNAIETAEAIEYLKGNHLPDTYQITTNLIKQMLILTGKYSDQNKAENAIKEVVANGKALAKFEEIIIAQKGNPKVLEDYSLLGTAKYKLPIKAPNSGFIHQIDARAIGYALVKIKAGRIKMTDTLDPAAGAYLEYKVGDEIVAGEIMGTILANNESSASEAASAIASAYKIAPIAAPKQKTILGVYP